MQPYVDFWPLADPRSDYRMGGVSAEDRFVVVQNWVDEVKRLVPTD